MSTSRRVTGSVIGSPIDVLTWDIALERIGAWSRERASRYVCICNVHSVVTARKDPLFSHVVRDADLATPDGAPVAWFLRCLGFAGQERINGPDLMWKYCAIAAQRDEAIYLYGGLPETLKGLQANLHEQFPGLRVVGAYSPPFRPLTEVEDTAVVEAINDSGASVVWVGLGCPKQEIWMAEHRGSIQAVMVGVGAAFDYHSGTVKRAPLWMQRNGLEWFYRLVSEPRRLWRRYLMTNSIFFFYAVRQLCLARLGRL